jgi:hypothetical protein
MAAWRHQGESGAESGDAERSSALLLTVHLRCVRPGDPRSGVRGAPFHPGAASGRAWPDDDCLQGAHEVWPHAAQLVPVRQGKSREKALTLRGDLEQDLSPIDVAATPSDEPPLDQAIRELHGAVMPNLQPFCENPDRWPLAAGESFDGEQELVLAWLDTGRPRFAFTEREEAADLIAKLGQGLVIRQGNHIVRRYNDPEPRLGTSFLGPPQATPRNRSWEEAS